jgi:superfamily II DNA or RNA helicase
MTDIRVTKADEAFLKIEADRGILQEISDRFTFFVPGYKFMPKFRAGVWDGKVRQFDVRKQLLPAGLIDDLRDFAKDEDYAVTMSPGVENKRQVTREEFDRFVARLKLPMEPREYQLEAALDAINSRRAGFLSPTSSGKSLIIYIVTRFMLAIEKDVMVIVPTLQLVHQMDSDFTDYNNGRPLDVHKIMGGVDKSVSKRVTVTTWQSVVKQPRSWFDRFGCVIGDEAHLFKAQSLVTILSNCAAAGDRFAFTGTLDGSLTSKVQIEGLFGRFRKVTTTEKLMRDGHVAELTIKAVVLKYPKEDAKLLRDSRKYNDEVNFLNSHAKRNEFIVNLVKNIKGNTLVLFKRVETHGEPLFRAVRDAVGDEAEVYFIAGKTDAEDRERVRRLIDESKSGKRIIIVGSSGTVSTGTNMKKLYNLVFVSASKSRVNTLQSLGRGLRLDGVTNKITLYDIVDDLRVGTYVNFALKHFMERVKMYDAEKFNYKTVSYEL